MPLTKIQSLGITDGAIVAADIASGAITAAKLASGVGGKVLQVITASDSTARTTSSSTFVTGSNTMSVTITPSSASNKIFVSVSGNIYNTTANTYCMATIFRGATDLGASSDRGLANNWTGDTDGGAPLCMTILDSPNTTSATTYQVYFRQSNGGVAILNESSCKGVITAFEIAG